MYYSALDVKSRSNIVEATITHVSAGKNAEMQNKVFVLDTNKQPLSPCHPARARELLDKGKAAVYRNYPFTIILKDAKPAATPAPVELKIDPGSKTTGMALVQNGEVIWAAELEHRSQTIRAEMEKRKSVRSSRRTRNTRYRSPGVRSGQNLTSTRPEKWLAPSLKSRVDNLQNWFTKIYKLVPLNSISMELVRFDTQMMQNAEISGVEYQQGELSGYEVREYLLEKFNRTCVYCDDQNIPLEIDHVKARSKGGSDRINNLVTSCHPCNQKKDNQNIEEFLRNDPARLEKILTKIKRPLSDAAAVNTVRWAIFNMFKLTDLPVLVGTGGRTKFNRISQKYPKAHWIDAACVGVSGANVKVCPSLQPLLIRAAGRGRRQMVNSDKYGFPKGKPRQRKRVHGFQTGDMVKALMPKGKYAGLHKGRVIVRANGNFEINRINLDWKHFKLIQRTDGYSYTFSRSIEPTKK